MSVQQNLSTKAREDVPDALLFGSADAKAKVAPLDPAEELRRVGVSPTIVEAAA